MNTPRALVIAVAATATVELALAIAASRGLLSQTFAIPAILACAWGLIIYLALAASRHTESLRAEISTKQSQHQATLDQVEQLEALNEMLVTLGRTKDVGLAFQGLARRVGRLVRCDRLGLAVMHENGYEVQTYLSRVSEPERRRRPRPEVAYRLERSLFGQVMRSCEPVVVDDFATQAHDFIDLSDLAAQGFRSAIVLPLMSRNRSIGTLTAISRTPAAFTAAHRDAMQPMAEVLAFAFVAQQQHAALQRYRSMETLAEVSLSVSTDVNSASGHHRPVRRARGAPSRSGGRLPRDHGSGRPHRHAPRAHAHGSAGTPARCRHASDHRRHPGQPRRIRRRVSVRRPAR